MPERLTHWPKKFNCRTQNMHFVGLMTMLKSCKRVKRRRRCSWCFSVVALAITISSTYTSQRCNPQGSGSIKRWNVCVALRRPNGIGRNSNRLKGALTAVLEMSSASTGIWYYAQMRLTLDKSAVPWSVVVKSWMCGMKINLIFSLLVLFLSSSAVGLIGHPYLMYSR